MKEEIDIPQASHHSPAVKRPLGVSFRFLSGAKIGIKITLLGVLPVLFTLVAVFVTMLAQNTKLAQNVDSVVRQQAVSEASKIARNAYLLCSSNEARNQKELSKSLQAARDLLVQAGGGRLAEDTVTWQATD